jgi:integrase
LARKLPARLHFNHGGYYYVHRNQWQFLGRDYGDALRQYAGLIAPKDGKMPDLLDRWFGAITVAASTKKTYNIAVKRLKVVFVEFRPEDVRPQHVYEFFTKKEITHSMRSVYRSVLIGAMQLAVREGLVERNLMREIENFNSKARDRYLTDGEFLAIWNNASETMRAIMDICYLTSQRIGDVLSIRYADLKADGIAFEQQKTKARLTVAWSPDLEAAVATARALHQSVKGMTLFHTRQGGKFSYSTIRTWWDRAIKSSGIQNAHIHDIRAKSATDAKKQGVDSMALLGHKSQSVHQRYLRNKESPVVQGIKMVAKS